jgi:hypothetical protein
MNKIKYIIIFTLLLALGLIYKQLIDYKNISNKLLNEVNDLDKQTKILKQQTIEQSNKIIELEQQHIEQEEYISTLKNDMLKMHTNTNETNESNQSYFENDDTNQTYFDLNESQEYQYDSTSEEQGLNDNTIIQIQNEINETSNEQIDKTNPENAITGYGLEHME